MPDNPRNLITTAERRFPVRIRIAVPPEGLGQQHGRMTAWLDENCGSDGWAMTPSRTRGVLNDALSIYFADPTPCERIRKPMVHRGKGRDGRRRVQDACG
jgi:hypothetical protein